MCNLKILLCDDSLFVRKKLTELLQKLNCDVFEARDGEEVVQKYIEYQPDAVFMDLVMPKRDGLQALKAIKEIDHHARVIMLSSAGTASNLMEALKLGAADFIQKPYTDEQIVKIVARIELEEQ
jgi:Response regulator containing CheY-like receiver, AAA-type ATPase, and DNA-binding domains